MNEPDSQVSGEIDPMFWPEEDVIAIEMAPVAWLSVTWDLSAKVIEATLSLTVQVNAAAIVPASVVVECAPLPSVPNFHTWEPPPVGGWYHSLVSKMDCTVGEAGATGDIPLLNVCKP